MTKSIPIDVNPNKPHFYPFMASLDRCNGSCNTLDYLPDGICVLNKADDLNLVVFDMITRKNWETALTKHASWDFKCKFDGQKCNLFQTWNKDYVWNPDRCVCLWGQLLHDGCPYQIENNTLLCSANQWSGFCMIRTSVMNELMNIKKLYLYEMLYW